MAAAAALQAGAWQIAAGVLARETVGAGTTAAAKVRLRTIATAVPAGPPTGTAPSATLAAAPRPAQAAVRAPEPGPVPAPDDAGTVATQRPFYDYRDVDVPAEPVGTWNLDPSALEALATSRIVFTLFVGSDGRILHCSVDEPERLGRAARKALEARLGETAMRPARRGGAAVASRRRVELFVEGGV